MPRRGLRLQELYRIITVGHPSLREPAAGSELSITVPGGKIWTPLALTVQFVTSATVGQRAPSLTYDDQSAVFVWVSPNEPIVENGSQTYCFYAEAPPSQQDALNLVVNHPLPALPLLPGTRIRTLTNNLQAGDNYNSPVLYVAEDELRGLAAQIAHELAEQAHEAGIIAIQTPEAAAEAAWPAP